MTVEIRRIRHLRREDLSVAEGYVSSAKYEVSSSETTDHIGFTLSRRELTEPYERHWSASDEDYSAYSELVDQGLSFGMYDKGRPVGIAISERIDWHRSLWVREFGIAESHRRKGLGRQLMDKVAADAAAKGLRILVCETQNTNVPAIDFYRRVGFEVAGVDLSYYTNSDLAAGEVAVFMKRKLE